MVDVVQNLTAIAEENAASTEETSASMTEVGNAFGDIADSASKLKEIANEMEKNMAIFRPFFLPICSFVCYCFYMVYIIYLSVTVSIHSELQIPPPGFCLQPRFF